MTTIRMKSTALIAIVLGVLVLTGCKKDEEKTESQPNRAPGEFTVSTAPDLNSALISWTTSTDPDGDAVTYMVILEDDTLVQASPQTFHEVMDLEYETDYTGRVIASDTDGLSLEKSYTFTTGIYPNQPPVDFNLILPADGASDLILNVHLVWNAAMDPDGDAVSYEILLDDQSIPTTSVLTDHTPTDIYYEQPDLLPGQTYYWQVIARDGNGGETASNVFSFTMRTEMTLATDEPGWAIRYSHTVTEFNGKMWVIGGTAAGGTHYGDIWSSEDGVTWTQELAEAPFGLRANHGAVVFDNKLWVIAGQSWYTADNEHNDVWYTEDGVNWTEATADAAFEPRRAVHALSYGGYMWLFGGGNYANDIPNSYSQVWRSNDGVSWELITDVAPHFSVTQMVVFDNKMWRIAAYNDDRVYSSNDGLTWILEQEQPPFGERNAHSCTVHDGKIWLLSGSDNAVNELYEIPDIWSSQDGVNWDLVSSNAGFSPVAFAETVSYDNKLWLLGGGGGWQSPYTSNDVWFLE